jgi:hypothetical protein
VEETRVAASGAWGVVEWAKDAAGKLPARDFYLSLSQGDRAKIDILFANLAENGRISNREKFRNLGEKAGQQGRALWEFKSFQIRFLGDFRKGYRFVVADGLYKRKDNLRPADIEIALRILSENDAREKQRESR